VSDEYQPVEADSPPIWRGDGLWPRIVVYGTYWCQDTVRSRNLLNRRGIPYTFVDIEVDPDAAQRVMGWNGGYLSTPTLDIDGRIVTEPSDEELAEILGLVE
jgi:mycoredoxin